MALLYGEELKKRELLKRAGVEEQLFYLRPVQYVSGDANLIKAYDINTGGGLEFSVLENKCLDIYQMKYQGMNVGFLSKAGLHSAYNVDQRGMEYRYSQGCGMLYTAGLANVGGACQDGIDEQYYHGMIKNKAAQNVSAKGEWQGDEYKMTVSGEMREAAFCGRNLVMQRKITTWAGQKRLVLEDCIENRNFEEDKVMLLYHLNIGYPLLREGAEFVVHAKKIEPLSDYSAESIEQYNRMEPPKKGAEEQVYCIRAGKDAEGMAATCLINETLGLGLYVKYSADTLPYMVEWKSMKEGDYAFGMLPSNCKPLGRVTAKEQGGLQTIQPFETIRTKVEIGILSSAEEIEQMKQYIALMQ